MVTRAPAYSRDHMKPDFAKLHWLPIRARVTFKIISTVFKIRQTRQPSCLAELIEDHVPSQMLRSTTCHQSALKESRTASGIGVRSFRYTAAKT